MSHERSIGIVEKSRKLSCTPLCEMSMSSAQANLPGTHALRHLTVSSRGSSASCREWVLSRPGRLWEHIQHVLARLHAAGNCRKSVRNCHDIFCPVPFPLSPFDLHGTKFFKSHLGRGRLLRKSWTSAPKSVFSCGPVLGKNSLTPGHPGVRVRNVHRKFGPKNLSLYCFFRSWHLFLNLHLR